MNNDFEPRQNTKPNIPPKTTEKLNIQSPTTPRISTSQKPRDRKFNPIRWFKGLPKKQKIIVGVAVFVYLIAMTGVIYVAVTHGNKKEPVAKSEPALEPQEEKPTTVASNLTGLQIQPELNERPVTAVMIENSPDARPQSGLVDAGVVFEAIAEGGITRFVALYQESRPSYIGPVRSVRPYYVDWLQGFDASIAHVGGSGEALAKIKNEGVKDLDQFANAGGFFRVNNRYAPHNMYTDFDKLDELNKNRGFSGSKFESFPRKEELKKQNQEGDNPQQNQESPETDQTPPLPTANVINLNISSHLYGVKYTYDVATNSYNRELGGRPHTDEKSGKQIAPKVVIAMVMDYGIAANGVNSRYGTIGQGKTYVFQDGKVIEGTWSKSSSTSQIKFSSNDGKEIPLNPGQVWLTAINNPQSAVF